MENIENIPIDYSFVQSTARIAVYDDLLSSPRILDIGPAETREFIASLATAVYESSHTMGGSIPFSIIQQVTENFIHAAFCEVVVSILDAGNTIRFTDQGPGIKDKQKAQQPGYSSATQEMKHYINGVGSGLPIVREYLETKQGTISIEDNMDSGAVVTISLNTLDDSPSSTPSPTSSHQISSMPPSISSSTEAPEVPLEILLSGLTNRSRAILSLFTNENIWGVKDISEELGIAASSTHNELKKLEEAGMITRLGTKRVLTELGAKVAQNFM